MKRLIGVTLALSVAFAAGCGDDTPPASDPDAGHLSPDASAACVAETDEEFCARLAIAECGTLIGIDNCDQERTADCGLCPGSQVCVTNLCRDSEGCYPPCSGLQTCIDGRCETGCTIDGTFHADGTLDPANPCQICQAAVSTSEWTSLADGTACDDGNACTRADACQAGSCVGADPVVCPEPDPCHESGVCDPKTGACSNPPRADGASCDDGNACTRSDTCQAGSCVGDDPVICPEADPCHEPGVCDPDTGSCSPATARPDGTGCDDANACTEADRCQAGVCSGTPLVCGENQTCTDGVCIDNVVCTEPETPCGAVCCAATHFCNANGVCEARCVPETDAEFCARMGAACGPKSGTDNCGDAREVADCGPCGDGEICTDNACVPTCAPETDAAFCARVGAACGQKAGTDNCGQPRIVDVCGGCGVNEECVANRCETTCPLETFHPSFTATGDARFGVPNGGLTSYLLRAELPGSEGRSSVSVQLYPGSGVFANGVRTGTYTLTGDELSFATCGLCVLLVGEGGVRYMPTGGTVELTSIAGTLSATLKNVAFQQVEIDELTYATTPHPSGCTTSLAQAELSGGCGVPSSYAVTSPVPGAVYAKTEPGEYVYGEFLLNSDPDVLTVELYAGSGVFAGGLKTGTFPLQGADLDYETCGLCVLLYDNAGAIYMPSGGTVTLSQISGNTFRGSLSNVSLRQVSIHPRTFETTPLTGCCTTEIPSLSFSAPFTP